MCVVKICKVKDICKGKKVLTRHGIGNILHISESGKQLLIGLGKGKDNNVEHSISILDQFYVEWEIPFTDRVKLYPLSYNDYEYMKTWLQEDHVEVFVSKNGKYVKLTEYEREMRQHIPYFNEYKVGKNILKSLEANSLYVVPANQLFNQKKTKKLWARLNPFQYQN